MRRNNKYKTSITVANVTGLTDQTNAQHSPQFNTTTTTIGSPNRLRSQTTSLSSSIIQPQFNVHNNKLPLNNNQQQQRYLLQPSLSQASLVINLNNNNNNSILPNKLLSTNNNINSKRNINNSSSTFIQNKQQQLTLKSNSTYNLNKININNKNNINKMKIINSPQIRIADLFKCFLKNVPKSTETIESIVHYGDNIGAKIIKCLINENQYETQSLLNKDYDIYQGPALCVTYDVVLKDDNWEEIFVSTNDSIHLNDDLNVRLNNNKNGSTSSLNNKTTTTSATTSNTATNTKQQQASKFISFFHISDFIAILSGYKVVFVDPNERVNSQQDQDSSSTRNSYVAMFDLENDTDDIEQFEDQFKPLEKIFNIPLLKNRYFHGTIIRLPLRMHSNATSISNKLVNVKDLITNIKDFMKEAHLHLLFSKNLTNLQFCRTKDGQTIEKIYSIQVEDSCLEQFKMRNKKINDAIQEGEFPTTSTIILTIRKQIESKIEKIDWILSTFADTMRLLYSNFFLMKIAIPISDNYDKDIRFSYKTNLISSDTGFIKTLILSKPIICYIEDKEGILMSHFCRLNINDSLKLSHFNDAYSLMLKDLTSFTRKDPSLLWSLMPNLDKYPEFEELLGEIWTEIGKHQLFYSKTEGWGYVGIEDMIINDVDDTQLSLQNTLTHIYSSTNFPVVIMPEHVFKALKKYVSTDLLQIMTPSQTSDILHNNLQLLDSLKQNDKIELLKYLLKDEQPRYIIDLPLLLLANNKFIKFQSSTKSKDIYLIDNDYLKLFISDNLQMDQFVNTLQLPSNVIDCLKLPEFKRATQVQMISDSDFPELVSIPKEWKNGDEKVVWNRLHDKYNLDWLENLWKYLNENHTNDLSLVENFNIIYSIPTTNSSSSSSISSNSGNSLTTNNQLILLYRLNRSSNIIYTPLFNAIADDDDTHINDTLKNNDLNETTYTSLIKILNKLGFICLDSIAPSIIKHKCFFNYVPNLRKNRIQLLKSFRNKYKHASLIKITQDFNALLNDNEIKLLRDYLSKIDLTLITNNNTSQSKSTSKSSNFDTQDNQGLIEILKELAIFENSSIECSDRYLPLKDIQYAYETQIRLPFELAGIKPFVIVNDSETRILIEDKLNFQIIKDFSLIIKEIMKYLQNKDLNNLSTTKIHQLAKWFLTQCLNYFLDNQELNDFMRNSRLFMNQKQELCSIVQLINPLYKEKYLALLDLKQLPAKDLLNDDKCMSYFKELKLRNCLQLRVDEIIDLYEISLKQNDDYRRLFAELIIDILVAKLNESPLSNDSNLIQTPLDKYLNEYSSTKAVTLRHFLMSVEWIPLKRDRPVSYPNSLLWKDSENSPTTTTTTTTQGNTKQTRIRFTSPRECVHSKYAYCVGSVAYLSDLEINTELKNKFDFKQVHLDLVVRHLKLTTKYFEQSAQKSEWYDYLTIVKKCYEFMSNYETQDIYRELKANDLNEWIWNGSGFSTISSIFIITEKDHPLCSHVAVLPYELYEFVKFFEKIGIKKQPDTKQLEEILSKAIKQQTTPTTTTNKASSSKTSKLIQTPTSSTSDLNILENAAKNYPLVNWIKLNHNNDKKLLNMIKEYEENLSSQLSSSNQSSPFLVKNATTSQTPIQLLQDFVENPEFIYLYLPELYKSSDIKENIINSVKTLAKTRQIMILDEEAYLARKISAQLNQSLNANTSNIFDHYRIYNEIILPNLNSLSKNIKDAVVLFAIDHADPKMLEILRDHPCIPVQPSGRQLRKPNKLVHPLGKIAPLYSDIDGRFPYGSEETYLREDRLQILKILGMKCDNITWKELIERADSVSKIREYEAATERAIAVLTILNEMLNTSITSITITNSSFNLNDQKEEKEAKLRACEALREIAFIPVKSKSTKLNLIWYGDKYKYRFSKPKEMLSNQYELICSVTWPVPLQEYKKKEFFITKQVEAFLGLDDLDSKFTIKDALRQLDEVSKLHLQDIDDQKELKLISDICFQVYEHLQNECKKKPNENIQLVREFFVEKRCILLNEEFIGVHQLCWELNVNLKSLFYQIPASFLRSFKYLFNQVLNIKVHLDLPDLLHVVDSMKKKYKDTPVALKEDFSILMNVYALIIDQGYHSITNLYLPNVNSVLCLGRFLHFYPINTEQLDKPDEYVHPAVDRRVCVIAGATIKKQVTLNNNSESLSLDTNIQSIQSSTMSRIFPRVFGNKRLEGILSRLDDDRIDMRFINQMEEGNPQIVLEYLLEANRVHASITTYLSEDDITVVLKYFNDFLARNHQGNFFNRIKELKIFKPLWSDRYIHLNFTSNLPSVYLISDEMASLLKRSFKHNPFNSSSTVESSMCGVHKSQSNSNLTGLENPISTPFIIIVRKNEILKLYSHLSFNSLNDLEAFLYICLPQFKKLDAKNQSNFLKYLYDEILEKCYSHDKEKCFKILREKLYIQSRKGESQLISDLYDMKNEALKHILNDTYFPDENFDSPQCLRFLKEAGLRTFLPSDLCKKCMNEIEVKVESDGWNDDFRKRSKWLYTHLIENWQRFDESVLEQRFLEPHCPDKKYLRLSQPFEYAEFKKTCIKLSDAELHKHEKLVWSSSYVLPSFVCVDNLDMGAIEFLKLNRVPCFSLVNQHLSNICETVTKGLLNQTQKVDDNFEDILIEVLKKCYQYLDDLHRNEHNKDIYKQLEDKDIIWSTTTRRFVAPNRICIDLEPSDEIPPFLFSLTPSLSEYKTLLQRLGSKEKPYAMLYGDILRKMAKVCGDDYLNSNEICKALKAMECFFKFLAVNNPNADPNSGENITPQFKLPGLFFVTTELKLEKSSNVVIIDDRSHLDYIPKLTQDKFVFNPSEKVLKMNTNEIKPLIDKIFISQRPTLFSQKYEESYDFSLPDDPDSQRQILLTSLERKYQQIFTSRQLHRCLARCISNEEARGSSPKHLPIDELEKLIRDRLSSIKVTCVEYLETSLSYRRLSNQQKLEQTIEERACYMTPSGSFSTIYLSKKHIEQPYFPLCLARSLQPLFNDVNIDYSIFVALLATSVSQMVRLLQLVNVASEENILSVIKLQYVPSSGKLYGDDVSLLAPFDPKIHNVLPGDLCVLLTAEGVYIYCQVIKVLIESKQTTIGLKKGNEKIEYSFLVQIDESGNHKIVVSSKDFHVLENWHRIYDALVSKPPDERETFKYSDTNTNANGSGNGSTNSSEGRRTPYGDNDDTSDMNSEKSDTSSMYDSNEQLSGLNQIELEQAKSEVNQELRALWGLEENDRKKKINRLLLKWHPDKNPGKEQFASEVFKHLKKQIEFYKTDPFLAGYYRSTYTSSSYGGFGSTTGTSYGASSSSGTNPTPGTDDFKSRHYGSFDDLHRKNSAPGGAGGSGASTDNSSDKSGPGPNLGRSGSFRQEWERRRQQKRHTTGTSDTSSSFYKRNRSYSRDFNGDRSSPSSARRRGTDFTHMDASLWFTQAKADFESADNDMHPIAGKPAYEWVCYKCYRTVEKALRAYHYYKGNGKLPASDIHGLLLGVEPNIRDIAFRFCNFIGNESNAMMYPSVSRFGKTPNEVFPLTKAEQAIDYAKELLKLVEDVIYAN